MSSPDEWDKTQDTSDATLLVEKNVKQAPLGLHVPWALPAWNPQLCVFRESHFLGER